MERWIKAMLAWLKTKARSGKDPEFWIDYIFENQEEPTCESILKAIEQGATFDMLLQFDPEIAENSQLKTWFQTLYDGLYTELHPAVDTAGSSGDTADAPGNASAGTDALATGEPVGAKPPKPKRR